MPITGLGPLTGSHRKTMPKNVQHPGCVTGSELGFDTTTRWWALWRTYRPRKSGHRTVGVGRRRTQWKEHAECFARVLFGDADPPEFVLQVQINNPMISDRVK